MLRANKSCHNHDLFSSTSQSCLRRANLSATRTRWRRNGEKVDGAPSCRCIHSVVTNQNLAQIAGLSVFAKAAASRLPSGLRATTQNSRELPADEVNVAASHKWTARVRAVHRHVCVADIEQPIDSLDQSVRSENNARELPTSRGAQSEGRRAPSPPGSRTSRVGTFQASN